MNLITGGVSPKSTASLSAQDTTNQYYANNPNALAAPSSSNSSSSSGTDTSGNPIAKALGITDKSGSALQSAALILGLLSAAGQYSKNKSVGNLPSLPQSGLGATTLPNLPGASYGPNGKGYNYTAYSGAISGTPGTGYAPRVMAAPMTPNSYYTYGTMPEHSFFTPVTAKEGGHISTPQRYLAGGLTGPGGSLSMGAPTSGTPGTPSPGPVPGQTPGGAPISGTPSTPSPGPLPGQMPGMTPPPSTTPLAQRSQWFAGSELPAGGAANPGLAKLGMSTAATNFESQPGVAGYLSSHPGVQSTLQNPGTLTQQGVTNWYNNAGSGVQNYLKQNDPNLVSTVQNAWKPYASGGAGPAPEGALSGMSRHVQGPGDGTSDSIPARLANGEYVMDAQTVSMLGNGDNGSGAKRLDEFRRNLRQHKGQALAQGKMAPDAKPVEHYMGGRR